ncbi:MAG: tRNA 2-thiouridine(34) synthase MnmA, partial [Rickettsiales bacterium]|nr:tRNA 2-thiouridine(34) synthase MnmA [Rickettsiales bacterium]
IALDIGLHNALKHDSQDICFIETDYKDFLNKNNARGKRGLIKHINGKILGEHGGIVNYTIGQRKGLGIASERPLYVAKIDAENNTVYVGDDRDLFSKSFKIKALSALGDIADGGRYVFKLRSTHAGQEGRINLKDCSVVLDEESRAITAGQLCAIYDGAQVVGGGWISGVEAKRE